MLLCVVVDTQQSIIIIVIRSRRMILTIFRRLATFYIKYIIMSYYHRVQLIFRWNCKVNRKITRLRPITIFIAIVTHNIYAVSTIIFHYASSRRAGHEPLMMADIDYPHKCYFEPKPDKNRFRLPHRTPNIRSVERIILINK